MYRVLNSFALINAVLGELLNFPVDDSLKSVPSVLLFCLGLLILAIRRQRKGDDHMWHGPVTSCAWFNSYGRPTVKRGHSGASSSSVLPLATPVAVANPGRARRGGPLANTRQTSHRSTRGGALPAAGPMRQKNSGSSSIIGSFSSNEFERGGMINPNAGRHYGYGYR